MFVSRTLRLVSLIIALAMLAACGQKAGVHVGFAGSAGGGTGQTLASGGVDTDGDGMADAAAPVDADGDGQLDTGTFDDGSGTMVAGDTGTGTGTTTTDGGAAGPTDSGQPAGDSSGDSGPSGTQGEDGTQEAPASTGAGNSTGITESEIIVGVHAPLTGAAPIPQRSFHAGKDQYWNVVGKVYGRTIKVVFRDDKYNPSAASQACQELIIK